METSTYAFFAGVGLTTQLEDGLWQPVQDCRSIEEARTFVGARGGILKEYPAGSPPQHEFHRDSIGVDWYLGHVVYPVEPLEGQAHRIEHASLAYGGYAIGSPVLTAHDPAGRDGGPFYEIIGYVSGPPEKFWGNSPTQIVRRGKAPAGSVARDIATVTAEALAECARAAAQPPRAVVPVVREVPGAYRPSFADNDRSWCGRP